MRLPVPTNRLVALTLAGALLTGVLAVGLTSPSLFPGTDPTGGEDTQPRVAADAPTPNADFTPAVQRSTGGEDHEYEEDEDDEDHEEWEEEDETDEEWEDEHENVDGPWDGRR